MIIVVEGADGAGKSTLVKQLSLLFDAPIEKFTKPRNQLSYEVLIYKIHSLASDTTLSICDRTPQISEYIYASIFNPPPLATSDKLAKGYYIYCKPQTHKIDTAYKAHKSQAEMRSVIDKQVSIQRAYDAYYAEHKGDFNFVFDYHCMHSYSTLTLEILSYLRHHCNCQFTYN